MNKSELVEALAVADELSGFDVNDSSGRSADVIARVETEPVDSAFSDGGIATALDSPSPLLWTPHADPAWECAGAQC